jgi:lipopolysaccharide cholinephosphotransferase
MKNYIYILLCLIVLYIFNSNTENFTPFEVLTDYKDLKSLNILTKKIVDIFHKNKFKYWACGGTMLGAVRDKGIIPWDDDVDLCIIDTSINDLYKMESELKAINIGMVSWFGGYKLYDINGKTIKDKDSTGKTIKDKDFKYPFIDLFIVTKDNNKFVLKNITARNMWPNEYYENDEIESLKLYDFDDYQLYGLKNPIKYLDRSYPDWRIKASKNFDHLTHEILQNTEFPIEYNRNDKPYLWQYWDGPMSSFIKLSLKTVDNHCSKSFNIIRLNKDNIYKYIPEMKEYENKIKDILIAQKVDIYRIMLLYKYGGIYLDADTVVLRDPIEIIHKLQKYDFVGFGCTGIICKNGYGKPSNWILAAKPHSTLIARVLKNQLSQITTKIKFDYHDLGKLVIWHELNNLIKNQDYEYFHYDNKIHGSRDKNGNWINSDIAFSNTPIDYEDEQNMLFFVFYNSDLSNDIKQISEKDLLEKDWNITKFIKRGLK